MKNVCYDLLTLLAHIFHELQFWMLVFSSHSKLHFTSFGRFGGWPTSTNLQKRKIWHNEYH
jgi:hypothetical protein